MRSSGFRGRARAVAVVAAALLAAPRPAGAQCPDGGPPPCRAQAVAPVRPPVAIDPRRVAVLPFRVTTADSLLGEGFAELLAQEFTGEGGPRSIEMSTTLNSWRRAGGGLRSPLAQDSARAVARRLGAGILCEGTIVGIGGRLSVTAALISSTTAMPIGAPARVAGPADSLESLLRQVAASLLGVGASERTLKFARLSQNPAALRSYLEGLTLWRQGQWLQAATAFEASVKADTAFGSALYQRWLYGQSSDGTGGWGPRVRSHLALLTPRERTVFEGNAGVTGAGPRTRRQIYEDRRRTAEQLGDSPEAWYFVGDNVYHDGQPVVGPDSIIPLARQFFSLAVGLDSQPVFLFHLMEIATITRDTTLARRLLPAYENIQGEERWSRSWVIAGMLNDAALFERLRRTGPPKGATSLSSYAVLLGNDSRIPTPLLDEALSRLATVEVPYRDVDVPSATASRWIVNMMRGRPVSAAAVAPAVPNGLLGFIPGFAVTGDVSDTAILRLMPGTLRDTIAEQRRQCLIARLELDRGQSVTVDSASLHATPRCRSLLTGWVAFNEKRLTDSSLARLDSLVTYGRFSNFYGFENRMLSRIYEARGDTARALHAIRMHPRESTGAWLPGTLREEGRLFLLNRDTTRAVEAYRHYLELRADAQPPYVAERDSVRAILSRLTRRLTP